MNTKIVQTVKPATKPATRTVAKPATVHGITLAMLSSLAPKAESFIANALAYHAKQGNVESKNGAVLLTPDGRKKMANRKGINQAITLQTKGGKSPQGTAYSASPKGFPVKFLFPFGSREEGTADSQAAFAALMLAASGK